ncbi:MAG: hypothetical protein M1830_005637 [Pleopsidium flavum]|nr:MAG: hypothetical protein M1830_005637 [Pleopsidium flavum]
MATITRASIIDLSLEKAISAADSFLNPVLTRENLVQARGKSLIERLITQLPDSREADLRNPTAVVIQAAVSHLRDIHGALIAASGLSDSQQTLYNTKSRRVVDGLLDLISLEGIYPALSPGVGIPIERRVKSVLQAGVAARPVLSDLDTRHEKDVNLLRKVLDGLSKIILAGNEGINPAVRERTLVDIICGCAELAYQPLYENRNQNNNYRHLLDQMLDQTPTPILFPILTTLLKSSCPQWLRAPLSTVLSLLPLRQAGVRQTLTFLATTVPQPISNALRVDLPANDLKSKGALSLETLTQASKLLSSVPSSLDPETYFTKLAPQLLDLLDNGPSDMCKAAAFIIGSGILGRRAYGAPGAIGWTLFAQPILEKLNLIQGFSDPRMGARDRSGFGPCIIEEADLQRALDRLTALLLSHPNPGLTKRLIGHVMLPLWGLLCYASKANKTAWYDQALKLLETYMKVAADPSQVVKLADEFLWNGGPGWTYALGRQGGIEIRKQTGDEDASLNIIEIVQEVDSRVHEFVSLLNSGVDDERFIGNVFLSISKRWLLTGSRARENKETLEISDNYEKDPMQTLISAKLAQKMLEQFKDKLAGNPDRIFELVNQLLEDFVENDKAKQQLSGSSTLGPSVAGLRNIVEHEENHYRQADRKSPTTETESEDDPTEIVSIALSLLSAILSSPGFVGSQKSFRLLCDIHSPLAYISTLSPSIPSSLSMAAANLISLLALQTSVSNSSTIKSIPDPQSDDRKAHTLALTYLVDPIIPVRAQGLSLLTTLILSRSPVLDIPATSILLLSLLQDEDEFIYLNAIKSLSLLAQNHSKTVVKMVVRRYVDRAEEMGLDQRLRLGEGLLKTVEGVGEALVGETASMIGRGMIDVAGRRGRRLKAKAERQNVAKMRQREKEEAEEAWGGEVPPLGETSENDVVSERHAKVVEDWEGKDAEEDVRIRTSALSVLGAAIETNVSGLGSTITSTAVDMTIAILTIESGDEKAILRRAAVLLILSLARAIDKAQGEGRELGFGFAGESLEEVVRVLQYIEATDRDDLVRGHTAAVIESLDTWRSRSILGMSSFDGAASRPRIALEADRLAGLSVNPSMPFSSSRRIVEVD